MTEQKCPFSFAQASKSVTANDPFFPERLNLSMLNQANANNPDPSMGHFEYAEQFQQLNLKEVKKDINEMLTTSQDWWPADYGNYAPFFIRQAWHQSGTYRIADGRGGANTGNQRFTPLNSWPDNANLDKARRLLWPIKQKYGRKLSWADLFMLTGNQALEIMGLEPFGFGGGRLDIYAPESDIYWGPEGGMLTDNRHENGEAGKIYNPLGASEMGLIYVNPTGPGGNPDPLEAAKEIRTTFGNMAMNDEETVALIAGGHTFGKSHGAYPVDRTGPPPENAPIEKQGLGYDGLEGSGKGKDTTTSGLEGAWTENPTKWDNGYFKNLFEHEWKLVTGPGGKPQWEPSDSEEKKVPDAHESGVMHKPMMFTTDLALKVDPTYSAISKRFYENHDEFSKAFAKAWYKLTHRDMGPVSRLLGPDVPDPQIWQDRLPLSAAGMCIDKDDIEKLKAKILGSDSLKSKIFGSSGPSVAELVKVAWASASTFRSTDFRGGANGSRIRLDPQKNWDVNDPLELNKILEHLEKIQTEFNMSKEIPLPKRISMADMIVLGGSAAVEAAAKSAGVDIKVPFLPGRMDALQEHTDVESFAPLEPTADGFRNYYVEGSVNHMRPEECLLDRAHLLGLTAPEMTVLVGGLRALGATAGNTGLGVLTSSPGTLSNDFFVNLLDPGTTWEEIVGNRFKSSNNKWEATRVDLIFGHNAELRSIAEYYACEDAKKTFVADFVNAWVKVMNADRFDVDPRLRVEKSI